MLAKQVEDGMQWIILVLVVLNHRILLRNFNDTAFVVT
jgi:hypothetical protein